MLIPWRLVAECSRKFTNQTGKLMGHTKREVGEEGKGTTKCGSRVAGIVRRKLVLICDITWHKVMCKSFYHEQESGIKWQTIVRLALFPVGKFVSLSCDPWKCRKFS
jgi:hypothetical protein